MWNKDHAQYNMMVEEKDIEAGFCGAICKLRILLLFGNNKHNKNTIISCEGYFWPNGLEII